MKNLITEPSQEIQIQSLFNLIPNIRSNKYFYENGLAKFIRRLKLKVHSDIEECQILWEKFSPNKSLFDLWDFRYSWHQGYNYKPYFYTLYDGKEPLGILPLYYSKCNKRYEWFGTNWMEDCGFYVKDDKLVELFLFIAPTPIHLNAIPQKYLDKMGRFGKVIDDDPKNEKDVYKYKTLDELLLSFKKKHRYNLKSCFSKIQEYNPRVIETIGPNGNLMDMLIKMNIDQFNTGIPEDESDLVLPERAATYRNIVKNSGIYKTKFIQIYIQNYLAAIDFIILYKDTYYSIKGGNDVRRFDGIGNYIIYYEFEDVIRNKFSKINSLQIDYGWKHRFFDQKPLLVFER
jgi:hypothetical protein